MVPRERHPQHRCLPARGVGAHHPGQQVKADFVYPDDGAPLARCFFLIAGQRSCFQAAMAASSRWLARMIGFWDVHPMRARRRLTCPGW